MRGHIRKRGNGYAVIVDLPRDPVTGKRRQKWQTAPTKREAERLLTKTLHQIEGGGFIEPSKTPLATYLEQWLEAIEPTIRPASHDRYTRIVRRQIVPSLGAVELGKLSSLQVQDWYAVLLAGTNGQASLSPSTVALYHGVLHKALDQAVKWQLVNRNVCDAVDAPRPKPPEMRTWSADESRAFLAGTVDHDLAALWHLALYTGMRRGELLALRWQDVDLERGQLAIRRTLTRGADGLVFGEPKTKAGRRSIAIPAPIVAILKTHRARQAERRLQIGPAWHDDGLVFDRGDGTVLHPNVVTHSFPRLARRLGLPGIRFHDLRHTAATLMLANGEHPKIVQERLGHADISMTLGRYSHVTQDMQRDAADRLARLLGS